MFLNGIILITWMLTGSPQSLAQEMDAPSPPQEDVPVQSEPIRIEPPLEAPIEMDTAAKSETVQARANIVLVDTEKSKPTAREVEELLRGELDRLGVQIHTDSLSQLPDTAADWNTYAVEKKSEKPGILAIFGWRCPKRTDCQLLMVESSSLAQLAIPVGELRGTVHESAEHPLPATHIAAGIREILYGDIIFDLPRVSQQINSLTPVKGRLSPAGVLAPSSDTPVRKVEYETFQPPIPQGDRRPFWLDFAYLGDYPYPSTRTIHGIALGASFFVHRHLAFNLRLGGLSRRKESGRLGTVHAYHMPVSLGVQFPFTLGSALFTVAAIVQYDVIWARAETILNESQDSFYSDFSFGGETLWRVPMPRDGLELFFGAGILGTLFSEDYAISDEKIMAKTRLQFYWLAGVSINIFAD